VFRFERFGSGRGVGLGYGRRGWLRLDRRWLRFRLRLDRRWLRFRRLGFRRLGFRRLGLCQLRGGEQSNLHGFGVSR
jgi:hypothetical protein